MAARADKAVIYHNPRCSTSRKTLDLLRDNGFEPTIVEYLKTPPARSELVKMICDAGIDVRTAVRQRESLYADLNLAAADDDLGYHLDCSTPWPNIPSSSNDPSSSPRRAPAWPGRSTRSARFCETTRGRCSR